MWQNIYYNISCSVESCSRSLTIGHSSFCATRLHIYITLHWAGPLCRVAGETRSRDWPGPLDGVGQPLLVHLGWDFMSSLDQMRRHKYLRLPHPVGPCNRPAKYNLMDSVSVFVDLQSYGSFLQSEYILLHLASLASWRCLQRLPTILQSIEGW